MKSRLMCAAALAALAFGMAGARAELAVSANDGKQMRPGDIINQPEPDSISVLDMSSKGVKLLGSVGAPGCMIGSPTAVALSHDSRIAIVTACQKFDGGKLVANNTASVVDLSVPSNPRVIQTIETGNQPGGVTITPNGKVALIANGDSNSVSIFTIAGKKLTAAGSVSLPEKMNPSDVVITPDGKTALAVGRGTNTLEVLAIKGTTVTDTGRSIAPGRNPYGAVVTHDGKYVINTNLAGANPPAGAAPEAPRRRGAGGGGGMARQGTISMSDIASGNVVQSVVVGPTPEHVVLSGDGRYIAVVVANGTASVKSDPKWDKTLGLLEVYKVGDGTLTDAGRSDTGHWCQGATFSKDSKTILLQCAGEREIEVFHFDGSTVTWDKGASIAMGARPGSISTAVSR